MMEGKLQFKNGLIIIPARGGSKGIKNKNIVNIGGKPLIYYTILPALKVKQLGLISDAIVSTDSTKIAEIAEKIGANIPFLRPKKISGDKAKSIDFVLHALNYFEKEGRFYDFVVLLQPTSPLRSLEDIKGAIDLFIKNGKDSLISVCREKKVDETELYYKKDTIGIPLSDNHNTGTRRQDLKELFVRNAAIYITSVKYLKKKRKIISDRPVLFEMPEERSLDIDTKQDLEELKKIMLKHKFLSK